MRKIALICVVCLAIISFYSLALAGGITTTDAEVEASIGAEGYTSFLLQLELNGDWGAGFDQFSAPHKFDPTLLGGFGADIPFGDLDEGHIMVSALIGGMGIGQWAAGFHFEARWNFDNWYASLPVRGYYGNRMPTLRAHFSPKIAYIHHFTDEGDTAHYGLKGVLFGTNTDGRRYYDREQEDRNVEREEENLDPMLEVGWGDSGASAHIGGFIGYYRVFDEKWELGGEIFAMFGSTLDGRRQIEYYLGGEGDNAYGSPTSAYRYGLELKARFR